MTKDIKKSKKNEYFGIVFSSLLTDWKKDTGESQEKFAELVGVQTSNSITNWKNGSFPSPKFMKKICEVFKVDESVFFPKTHDDQYRYSPTAITEIGRKNKDFAEKNGLNLELVHALSELIDFDLLFPKYSPIMPADSNFLDRPTYVRKDNSDSATIDRDFKYLQLNRDGKTYTLHKCDLAYLKEVQDQIVDFVEFLFFKRAKEMEDEVRKFNVDINSPIVTLNGVPLEKTVQEKYLQIINNPKFNIPNDEYTDQLREELTEEIKKIGIDTSGTIDLIYPEVTEEFILQHDRFAKYFDVILPKKKKATQKDIDSYFKKEGK